jgi:serine/threonine-protein kinase
VHRDVSPQNVLLSGEGAVKLGDFGIARAAGMGGQTDTGMLKGKIGYMAPEQVLDTGVDARTDLYAAGIVLYELLTGRHPFATSNEAETLRRARNPEIVPPRAVRPSLDPGLDELVMRALQIDKSRRYASGGEMLHAIEAYLRDHAMAVTATDVAALVRVATLAPTEQEPPVDLDSAFAEEIERLGADAASGLSRFTRTRVLPGEATTAATRPETPRPEDKTRPGAIDRTRRSRWAWTAGIATVALALFALATWASSPHVLGPPLRLQPIQAPTRPPPRPSSGLPGPVGAAGPVAAPRPSPVQPAQSPGASAPEPGLGPSSEPGNTPRTRGPRAPVPTRPVRAVDAGSSPDRPPVPQTPGTLRIGSAPHWARISIDGVVRGTTPLVVSLPPGPHVVSATNPDRGRSESRRVTVEPGRGTSVRFDPF